MISVSEFEKAIKKSKKPGERYPRHINISFCNGGNTLQIESIGILDKKKFRSLDPWALSCVVEAKQKTGINISNVIFSVNKPQKADTIFNLNFESFRRRLSFLKINNPKIKFELDLDRKKVVLDDKTSLFHRPANEIIRSKISQRSEDNDPNFLEKSFQSFLYGKGLKERTNDRLAILGEDFYQMKGKAVRVLREFPTGVFDEKISNITRILPTESVDIVTQNKWGNLAIIELKVDNSELEVISQILDYALYFASYRNLIIKIPDIKDNFDENRIKKENIFCYVANNHFHPRFDGIIPFYSNKNKSYGFRLRKIILGETTEI